MKIEQFANFLKENKGYLDWGTEKLSTKFNLPYDVVNAVKQLIKSEGYGRNKTKDHSPKKEMIKEVTPSKKVNTLFIPDLHLPFVNSKALEFCINLKNKWNCERIIFLGDILDNHFPSFHNISTKAKGGEEELELARQEIKPWYKAFPNAYVCSGNHDSLNTRVAEANNLPLSWIKSITEVLNVPNWKVDTKWEFDNFVAIHGTDGKSIKNKLFKYGGNKSIIQGHFHTATSLEYFNNEIFGMQLGALINRKSYAFEYANNHASNVIMSAGIIVNGVPIIEILKD